MQTLAAESRQRSWSARWAYEIQRLLRLAHKELREILRDRRTIVTLVLMPLLLYPLLTVVMRQFLFSATAQDARPTYRIGIADREVGGRIVQLLSIGGPLSERMAQQTKDKRKLSPADLEFVEVRNLETALRLQQVDVGIRSGSGGVPNLQPDRDFSTSLDLLHLQNSALSVAALEYLKERIDDAGRAILRVRLRTQNVTQSVRPIRAESIAVDRNEKPKVKSLATMIPLILILMTITGAVYPAIDLTAGERERNTLEILVAAPTPRLSLLLGKYVAVLTVAILTATVNLFSMGVTLSATGMSKQLLGEHGLTPLLVAQIFSLMVLFAAFFSGMLLALCSFARSFKEAQAYLIPLMLVSLAPGIASLIPGIELTGVKVVAPLLNIVLVGRDLMDGRVNPTASTIAVLSTAMYALAAIAVAARLFGSEGVLYSNQGGWQDLFSRPEKPRPAPSISGALLCLALLFPTYFIGSNLISSMGNKSEDTQASAADASPEKGTTVDIDGLRKKVLAAAILQVVLFAGAPLFAAYRGNIIAKAGFQLNKPPALAWPAAVLMGLSMWPFAHELVVAIFNLGFSTFGQKQLESAEAVAKALPIALPYFVIILVFAILPAVSEELLFRGYVFTALRTQLGGVGCVLGSAALFGLFHFVVTDALAIERLLPSSLLGAAIGFICWKSGSIFPGMLAHLLHNGLLMSTLYYRDELLARGIGVDAQKHLPTTWLVGAGFMFATGIFLLTRISRQAPHDPPGLPTV